MIQTGKIYKKKKLHIGNHFDTNSLLDLIYPDYILLLSYNDKTEINGENWSQYLYCPVDTPDKKAGITKETFIELYEITEPYEVTDDKD